MKRISFDLDINAQVEELTDVMNEIIDWVNAKEEPEGYYRPMMGCPSPALQKALGKMTDEVLAAEGLKEEKKCVCADFKSCRHHKPETTHEKEEPTFIDKKIEEFKEKFWNHSIVSAAGFLRAALEESYYEGEKNEFQNNALRHTAVIHTPGAERLKAYNEGRLAMKEGVVKAIEGKRGILWAEDIQEHGRRVSRDNAITEILAAIRDMK